MMTEMKILLWKDLRLSRLCLLAGVMFIIGPYMLMYNPYIHGYDFNQAWIISSMISQFTITLVAGNIISCERADRSAAFLAYQGVTRKKIITSKLIICAIVFVSICAISFILSFWLKDLSPDELEDFRKIYFLIPTIGFGFFGCCWLLSDLLTSPVAAIVFGFFPLFFIGCGLRITSFLLKWPINDIAFTNWYIAFITAAGLISLVAGTWHFLRSKES
jgi:ABC-type transport system involved in multi-copper enzyme maturation permease subunit